MKLKVKDRMKLVIATGDSIAIAEEWDDTWNVRLALEGSGAQCVAIDPHDEQTIYAGAWGEGIWKSSDGGVRWSNLSTALTRGHVFFGRGESSGRRALRRLRAERIVS
jgi:hypothetical protein